MFRRRQNLVESESVPTPAIEPLVAVDPYLGSNGARELCTALAERRFGDLIGVLGACSTIEERAWAVQVAADDPSLTDEIRGWCSAHPDSSLPITAWGASLVAQAWARRAGKRYADMQQAEREQFFETLRNAEQALHSAARMSPTSPLPWLGLLRSGRGLEISRHELRLRYQFALVRNASGLEPHQQMLQGLSAKWGGSHDEMFDFARQVVAGSPLGSPLHTVLALAHFERGVAGDQPTSEYMASVADEIRQVGERSVDHPAFVDDSPGGAQAQNTMCLCYSLCGDHELSQRQRVAMKGRLARFPWNYLGEPEDVFSRTSPRESSNSQSVG